MLKCISIMGFMFFSDGTSAVPLNKVTAMRLTTTGAGRAIEIGNGLGRQRFDVSGYTKTDTIEDVLLECALNMQSDGFDPELNIPLAIDN